MYVNLIPLLCFLCLFHNSLECPLICDCEELSSGFKVDCSKRKFTAIPSNIPINTNTLYLYDNNIITFPEDSLSHLESLTALYLYNNQINGIPQKVFWNLKNLEILHMANNKVNILFNDTFKYQTKLKELSLVEFNDANRCINMEMRKQHLQQNNITHCAGDVFSSMESLEFLYLYENGIRDLSNRQFKNLTSLKELHIQSNEISSFSKDMFEQVTSLEKLDLSKNRLTLLESFSFFNLSALKSLYLSSNGLTSILTNTFVDLVSLSELYLYDNKISTIEYRAFVNLPILQKLQLHLNDIICDCNIRWIWNWLKLRPTLGSAEAVCKDTGQYIIDVDRNSFTECNKISVSIQLLHTCDRLNSVKLTCTSEGQGGISSTWFHLKNNKYVKTLSGNLSGNVNELTIERCSVEDTGNYICSWTTQSVDQPNINGSTVLKLNVDLGLPSEMSCNVSSSILVACNFSYTNIISNTWVHSLNGVTVRQLSGKVDGETNYLNISQCNQQDSGKYTCEWTENESEIVVNNNYFTLNVMGPPVIHDRYASSTATSHTLIIRFLSTPLPSHHQWMFGNVTVQSDSEYDILLTTANITVLQHQIEVVWSGFVYSLTIKHVTEESSGTYSFKIGNTYGSVEGTFEVNTDTTQPSPPVEKEDNNVTLIVIIVVCVVTLTITGAVVVTLRCRSRILNHAAGATAPVQVNSRSDGYLTTGQSSSHQYDSIGYDYIDALTRPNDSTAVNRVSGASSAGYTTVTFISQDGDENYIQAISPEVQTEIGIENTTLDNEYEEPVHSRNADVTAQREMGFDNHAQEDAYEEHVHSRNYDGNDDSSESSSPYNVWISLR